MIYMILTILLPAAAGAALPLLHLRHRARCAYVTTATAAVCALAASSIAASYGDGARVLFSIASGLDIAVAADGISAVFAPLFALCWLIVAVYAFMYVKHEGRDDRFFAFFLLSLGAMMALAFSANLVTMYLSFEFATLCSMPLVLHTGTKEATAAAVKYLFYSIAGAFMGLFGIVVLFGKTGPAMFALGGVLDGEASGGLIAWAIMLSILGFGTKAGMYPMHGWLPTAHPAAPAPASALLSGIIAKAGVLAVIRVVFYTVGEDAIRGTWVQTAWTALAALTVLVGSMMAYREDILKKRLAYSTVSNISYIMLGLSTLTMTGFYGAILHVIAHAFAKCALFLCAGSIIYKTERTRVSELSGIGRRMPVTMAAFTAASLSLIGIPPFLGFSSKWYLCLGGLDAGGAYAAAVPIVLIISALLTAGYLLPPVISGFFPGGDGRLPKARDEAPASMTSACVMFSALSLIAGIAGGAPMDVLKTLF